MQYNKLPPKSPESPVSDPNGENQEAIVIFTKGVSKLRKLSRNGKKRGSTTTAAAE